MILETALEQLGDCWPVLRDARDHMCPGEVLTVRFGGAPGFRLSARDVAGLLRLAGFEAGPAHRSGTGYEMEGTRRAREASPFSCSVIVPCRNEIGNVDELVRRLPPLGTETELIFVDGASTDGTPQRIEEIIRDHPDLDIKLLHQWGGGGKAAAVYQGFDAAKGEVMVILDADMTVAPEDLPRFYLALAEGVGTFANGTRFIYPMQMGAMPGANNLGNRVFSALLSWLIGTRISDTLCGTKALFKRDWLRVSAARPLFGEHDPWGDFDLLLGAAHAGLRVVDVPIRYGARVAGESKMRPLQHGVALGRTCLAGVRHLKF